ncbi:hypothetical protein B0H14DRAFT_3493173 [Mycena olivaceomarginata]|nr:hypothetical protein B0H14DRAFT_3493173 [Mycena olivaceomarginata]
MAVATETCQELFIPVWKVYCGAVVQEAKDRHEHTVPLSFYNGDLMCLRKLTSAVDVVCFIGKDRPQGIFGHPTFICLAELTAEIIDLENMSKSNEAKGRKHLAYRLQDTYSFQKENGAENIHNHILLKAIMHEQGCSLQDGLYHAEKEIKVRAAEIMALVKTLHSQDPNVEAYIDDLGTLIMSNMLWSFETEDRKLVLTGEKKRGFCLE